MRISSSRLAALMLAAIALPHSAQAGPKLTGFFVASETCPAFRSKNAGTNPGDVMTTPGRAYAALEQNMAGGDWYRIRVPGALEIEERWVSASCGTHTDDAGTAPDDGDEPAPGDNGGAGDDGGSAAAPAGAASTNNVLTVSWQPAFCESKPDKAECEALNDGQLPSAAAGFSLHGLWPQGDGRHYPYFCDASDTGAIKRLDKQKRWSQMPPISLSDGLKQRLDVAMPGTASHLELHEWHKHGSCFRDPGGPEGYFTDALKLLDELNASAAAQLVDSHVGGEVALSDLDAAFDQAFGAGTADKLKFSCSPDGGRDLLGEIMIPLGGTVDASATLKSLIAAAPAVDANSNCPAQITIDPAGLQ